MRWRIVSPVREAMDERDETQFGITGDAEQSTRALRLVRKLLDRLENQLDGSELRGTAADFIRLLQLEQELQKDEIREIRVRWIDRED